MQAAKPVEGRPPAAGGRFRQPGLPSAPQARPALPTSGPGFFSEVGDPTAPGLRRNGVVFFVVDGFPARCSGTSVSARGASVVFTAGHCVAERSGRRVHWFDSLWVFVPGYRYGQRPFGVFPALHLDATRLWRRGESEDGDIGAAVVTVNERGESLHQAVGGDRIAFNRPPHQVFDVHGYPVAPPFDGKTQRLCSQTPFLGHDTLSYLMEGPRNLSVACDVTGGASGGGWTIEGDVLNGVTDYGYPLDPTTDYGSYFGREAARLYHRVGTWR